MANKVEKTDFNFDEWHGLIGRAIVACCEIELITYKYLTYLPSENIFEVVADLSFTKRVNLICKLVEDKPLSEELRNNFLHLLNKSKKMSEIRNIIVHNPLQVSFYENENGGIFVRPEIQTIRKKQKILDLNDIRIFAVEVEKLSSDLHVVVGQVFAACNCMAESPKGL